MGATFVKKLMFKWLVELTGNQTSSKILKTFTASKWSRYLNASFAKVNRINTDEMEKPLHEYTSLQALFTRKLKEGVRTVDRSPRTIVSPVDAVVTSFGKVSHSQSFLVKGQSYKLEEIFGGEKRANVYKNGTYFIFYLSPAHYHRIHSPVNGTIREQWTLGNSSYPVNNIGLTYGSKPLSTNYRLITTINHQDSQIAVVKVGALNVNSIHLTHEQSELKKGEEVAYFSFGSTVILFIEKDDFHISANIRKNMNIQYGTAIGVFQS